MRIGNNEKERRERIEERVKEWIRVKREGQGEKERRTETRERIH